MTHFRYKKQVKLKIKNTNCELNFHDQKIWQTLTHDIQKHWTAVSTLLGLISSVYCNLPLEIEPAITAKLYNWATSPYHTQVTPNQLVMVIAQPINLKMFLASYIHTLCKGWSPHVNSIHNIILLKRKKKN